MSNLNTSSSPANLFSVSGSVAGAGHRAAIQPGLFLQSYHSSSIASELIAIANALVNPRGKGIYATDETPDAIEATLVAAAGRDVGEKTNPTADEIKKRRKAWRECAYASISSDHIAGVIMYAETLLDFGLAPILTNKGIIPGVRANGELAPLPLSISEFIVEGLDGLLANLQAARAAGARFSKWRVTIACTSVGLPSSTSLEVQAETLARFAAISQQAGLVPIIEPDVEFSADASLERSVEVHENAIRLIYTRCAAHGILLEGSLIKPSFPQPGRKNPTRATVTAEQIALATATVIARSVPVAVPGVVFLSGGLESSVAVGYLAALNALVAASPSSSPFSRLPRLSFSFGRALQGEAMQNWVRGDEAAAKQSFTKWSEACWRAAKGEL
ncbi:fructose-bisphosphate aldolase [Infundibulicybe gibba]|nr:fructose-bisphosphate aldolase [Infundibulicybe gibba]